MSTTAPDPLVDRRQALQRELLEQRQRLALRLGSADVNGRYPRSMTMRFLTRHPLLAMRMFTTVTRLFRKT